MRNQVARNGEGTNAVEFLLSQMDERGQIQLRMDLSLTPVEIGQIAMTAFVNSVSPQAVVAAILRDQLTEVANRKYKPALDWNQVQAPPQTPGLG